MEQRRNNSNLGSNSCNDIYRLAYYWKIPGAQTTNIGKTTATISQNASVKVQWVAPRHGNVHIKGHIKRTHGLCYRAFQEVVASPTCATVGASRVTRVVDCAAGASSFSYNETAPRLVRDNNMPVGCFYWNNQLYLNPGNSNVDFSGESQLTTCAIW